MGAALVRCSCHMENVQVAAALETKDHPDLGKDVGILAGVGEIGVPVTDDHVVLDVADVLIDFSFHEAVPGNVQAAVHLSKPMVIGTTGLSESESEAFRAAAKKIAILQAPNMSVGMNLLFAMVGRAAATLGTEYDAEIVETHHKHKKDAPSGTALSLGRQVATGRGQDFDTVVNYGREGVIGERPDGQIGVHAVRAGDTVGDHTVIFATDGERVELSHRATSRDTFAMGALRAALWVTRQAPGLYGMQDLLGL